MTDPLLLAPNPSPKALNPAARTVGHRVPAGHTAAPSAPSPVHLALHKLLSIALKYLQQPETADTSVHMGYNLMLKLLTSRFPALSSSYMSVSPKSQACCLSAIPDACTPLLLAPSVHTCVHMPNAPSHTDSSHTQLPSQNDQRSLFRTHPPTHDMSSQTPHPPSPHTSCHQYTRQYKENG